MKFIIYNSVYENNSMKQTIFSPKTLISNVLTRETLDESLAQCKVSLLLNFEQEYTPYTRFFIDIYDDAAGEETHLLKRLDYVLETDIVDRPSLSENFWIHQLNLVESSAAAQAIILPNCSLTWLLDDTLIRYYGSIPQGLTQQIYSNGYRTKRDTEETRNLNADAFNQMKNVTQSGRIVTNRGGGKLNPDRNTPIVLAQSDTAYNFTYNIPQMYLDLSYYNFKFTGFAWIGKRIMSYFWRGEKELSTVTIMYVNGIEKSRTYHNGASTLYNKEGSYDYFYDRIKWFGADNDTEGLGLATEINSKCPTSCMDRINYYTDSPEYPNYYNFNTNKIDNYNIGSSVNSITIDLLSDDYYDKQIRFVTYPYVKMFKVSNGSFLSTFDPEENPTFGGQIEIQQNTGNRNFMLPISSSGFNLSYEYSIRAVKSDYSEKQLVKSAPPYNAYDMLNKLQISYLNVQDSGETLQELYNKLPFQFDDDVKQIALETIVPEVSFAQKSLFQAIQFLCYFMGGIPKIEALPDSPSFVIHLKKLGGDTETNYGNLISIYNSKHMSEFVTEIKTEYQNLVNSTGLLTEIIHPSSDNETNHYSVDNIALRTKYDIDRVAKIRVYDITNSSKGWAEATDLFFSEQIYNMLSGFYTIDRTSDNQYEGTIPNKGMCLYYTHGSNRIQGLQYKCPEAYDDPTNLNNTNCYAIKNFLWAAFNRDSDGTPKNPFSPNSNKEQCYAINPSNYIYEISYVPIVNSEISSVRPDLRKYFLNDSISKYPMYQQRSQASEYFIEAYKLGNKNYGELIRQSNTVYEVDDWFEDISKIHQPGEIYRIDNLYYINTIQTEYCPDFITQHISLTKDFNRLSQYIGLDSQSRWYRVPEQYSDRYINQKIFLYVYTEYDQTNAPIVASNWVTDNGKKTLWQYILKKKQNYPTSAQVTFYSDQPFANEGNSVSVVLPVASLPVGSTLSMSFDCKDNFSPGAAYIQNGNFKDTLSNWSRKKMIDSSGSAQDVIISDSSNNSTSTKDNSIAYWFPNNDSYCDLNGRAQKISIDIAEVFKDSSASYNASTRNDIYCLPFTSLIDFQKNVIGSSNNLSENSKIIKIPSFFALKDAGERMLFVVSSILETGSDRFSFSRYLWETNSNVDPTGCKWIALNKEITKFVEPVVQPEYIISTYYNGVNLDAEQLFDYDNGAIRLNSWLSTLSDTQVEQLKSVALVTDNDDETSYLYQRPILYRNVYGAIKEEKICDWLFKFM